MKKYLLFALMVVLFSSYTYAFGCCINPNAANRVCERLADADIDLCCPNPADLPEYYSSGSDPGPPNQGICESDYFLQGVDCEDTVAAPQCTQRGCCCVLSEGATEGVVSEIECRGPDKEFNLGTTECLEVCEVPACNDDQDNDADGCSDFPLDTGCESPTDTDESGGICLSETGPNCQSIGYTPQILSFTASPIKGEKIFELNWIVECEENVGIAKISRCEGPGCSAFIEIGQTQDSTFIDGDENLLFDTPYTYRVDIEFTLQTNDIFETTSSANLGNIECWNRFDASNFCIHEPYYNQYQDYIIRNLGFTLENFFQSVQGYFGSKLNRAYSCDFNNILNSVSGAPVCNSLSNPPTICVISNNQPLCIEQDDCVEESSFLGFLDRQNCEEKDGAPKYCFFDRSISILDACFACDTSMSCYDYKSQDSCSRDNCFVGNCEWKDLEQNNELGTGVCVSTVEDNCQWCDQTGTPGIESSQSTSLIFEQCTQRKADLLSSSFGACYYDGQGAQNCNEVSCTDYDFTQCDDGRPQYNDDNQLINPSNDACGIGTCEFFPDDGGSCRKNADKDAIPDCTTPECEQDIYPPTVTVTPVIERGIYKGLEVQILDQSLPNSAPSLRRNPPYKVYFCNEDCQGHPYDQSTSNMNLVISALKVIDEDVDLLFLDPETNVIKYYAEDPAHNIGEVQTLIINDPQTSTEPVLLRGIIEVTGANAFTEGLEVSYYTAERSPQVRLEFADPAVITSAILGLDGTAASINPTLDGELKEVHIFSFTDLNQGSYSFEINARNDKDVYMSEVEVIRIVVDDTPPVLRPSQPEEGEILTSGQVDLDLVFDSKVNITSALLNGESILDEFQVTLDFVEYSANLDLEDNNYNLELIVEDFAGNQATITRNFIVNARDITIDLAKPSYGVAGSYTFDIEAITDNNAECRFDIDTPLEFLDYDLMRQFTSTGGTSHTFNSFNQIPSGDTSIHKLNIWCKDFQRDSELKTEFDLSVDDQPPGVVTSFATPDPISEEPRTTTLSIQTNKETQCKYSRTSSSFDSMTGLFPGFGNDSFAFSNRVEIEVPADGDYQYNVICQARSELLTSLSPISFSSNLNLPIDITDNTPEFSNVSSITLAIGTNKRTQCRYGTDSAIVATSGTIFGQSDYSHTVTLTSLASRAYTYYVTCRDPTSLQWVSPQPIQFTIDTTPPTMLFVDDTSTLDTNPEFTWRTDQLRVRYKGNDTETGIHSYLYMIEEFSALGNANIILNWTTSFQENEWIWATKGNGSGLDLTPGSKYFFSVLARNTVGLTSNALDSDGITIDPTLVPADCSNNQKDPSESDVDCGGPCGLCGNDQSCNENGDCASGFCNSNGVCEGATCTDDTRNQDESDVDCGGNICDACSIGDTCGDNSDCSSNFCSFGKCEEATACQDGILSGSETDVDCGGSCPEKCSIGKTCGTNFDCQEGARCVDLRCAFCDEDDLDCDSIPNDSDTDVDGDGILNEDDGDVDGDGIPNETDDDIDGDGILNEDDSTPFGASDSSNRDTDGDGIPDGWELEMGLDPNDPSDADLDYDNDDVSNYEEYSFRTDPNNSDSDGDGASDRKEINKNTDPLDPTDKPGLSFFWILLLLILLLALIGGGAYYYYEEYNKPKKKPMTTIPRYTPRIAPVKPAAPPKKVDRSKTLFNKRAAEKKKDRNKLLDGFGSKKDKSKGTKDKSLVSKSSKKSEEGKKWTVKIKKEKKGEELPQAKGDSVFSELKLISKEEYIKNIKKSDKRKGSKTSIDKLKEISSSSKKTKK